MSTKHFLIFMTEQDLVNNRKKSGQAAWKPHKMKTGDVIIPRFIFSIESWISIYIEQVFQ